MFKILILFCNLNLQIRSLVLDRIISEKLYDKFLKTKYFPLVKQQLMNTHRVKELVEYFAKKNW